MGWKSSMFIEKPDFFYCLSSCQSFVNVFVIQSIGCLSFSQSTVCPAFSWLFACQSLKLNFTFRLAESAMAVIRETIKQIDVMKIEGKQQGKPVFSLDGLDYGNFRDSLSRVDKYWWFGSLLKPYLALIMNPQV